MKKILLISSLFLSSCVIAQTVVKLTALPITSSGTVHDYLIKNDSSGGTGTTKIITVANFISHYLPTIPTMTLSATSPLFYNPATSTFSISTTPSFTTVTTNTLIATTLNVTGNSTLSNTTVNGNFSAPNGTIGNGRFSLGGDFDQYMQSSTVASASTMTLSPGSTFLVSGTTTINAIADIGSGTLGAYRTMIFQGVLTLTNNSSLVLTTGANITTAAGDVATFVETSISPVIWKMAAYTKANGQPLAGSAATNQTNIIYIDAQNGTDDNTSNRGNIEKPFATVEYVLANTVNTGTVTATTTNGSYTLTAVSSTANISMGQFITGTGIPFNSKVVSFTSNTIVLNQTCIASGTITATWWTPYVLKLSGTFTATGNWFLSGFRIDASNATINFGNMVLFNCNTTSIIPEYITLGFTRGTNINSGLIAGTVIEMNLDYGDYYSIGNGYQIGTPSGGSRFVATNFYVKGKYFNAAFGSMTFINCSGNFEWNGDGSGLLMGIEASANNMEIRGVITTPSSVLAINAGGTAVNIYGEIVGSVSIGGGTYTPINIYANITGSTVTCGSGNIERVNLYGNITATINNYGPLNIYGYLIGNLNNVGLNTITDCNILKGMNGTCTVTTGSVSYRVSQEGTHSSNDMSIVIGAGKFINYGSIQLNSLTWTGNGKYIEHGHLYTSTPVNTATATIYITHYGSLVNEGGAIINSATDGGEVYPLITVHNGYYVSYGGRMYSPCGLFINYVDNTDSVIYNASTTNGNIYSGISKSCGAIRKLGVTAANTATSVTINDGTNTVTVTSAGTGETIAQIIGDLVTAIKASALQFQYVAYNPTYGGLNYVGPSGATVIFSSLTNATDNGTYAGGGGYTPTALGLGTEYNNPIFSY